MAHDDTVTGDFSAAVRLPPARPPRWAVSPRGCRWSWDETGEGGGPGDQGAAAFGIRVTLARQYQLLACQKDQASQALP
jgi:hypothetical protein